MNRLALRGRFVITDPSALPGAGMIEDGAVLVEKDRVVAVGQWRELEPRLDGVSIIGGPSHMVVPGFVNAHHHGRGLSAVQLGVRDAALETWLPDFWAMPPLDVYADTLHANLKMIRSGITTVLHSSYAREWGRLEAETDAALSSYRDAGLRVAYAVGFEDRLAFTYWQEDDFLASLPPALALEVKRVFAPPDAAAIESYLAHVTALAERFRSDPAVNILFGPSWHPWCTPEFLRKLAEAAVSANVGVHIHALESPLEAEHSHRHYGADVTAYFADLGLMRPGNSLAHGTHLNAADRMRCAASGTSVCHNPSSNLRLRNGVAPVSALLRAGANVALGMDSWSLGSADNIMQEARLALSLQHGLAESRFDPAPNAFDALRMMTSNGGAPTGFGDTLGRLVPGAFADAVIVDFGRMTWPYLEPAVHPVEALISLAEPHHIEHVVCGGIAVLEHGVFPALDEKAIGEAAAASARDRASPDFVAFQHLIATVRPYLAAFYGATPSRREGA